MTSFESLVEADASAKKADRPSVKASASKSRRTADSRPSTRQATDRTPPPRQGAERKAAARPRTDEDKAPFLRKPLDKKAPAKQGEGKKASARHGIGKKPSAKETARRQSVTPSGRGMDVRGQERTRGQGRPQAQERTRGQGDPRGQERARGQAPEGQGQEQEARISKFAEWKRAHAKNKAEKKFSRQFENTAPPATDPGPRAALYKGEMGHQHKRMAQMQQSAVMEGAAPKGLWDRLVSPKSIVSLVMAVSLVLACTFFYPVAQQFYLTTRHYQQQQAEQAAVNARNEALQDQVDTLSSPEGIEDRARKDFGWIKEGEEGGVVNGLDQGEDDSYIKDIPAGSVEPPQSWYTPLLDMLFGVK